MAEYQVPINLTREHYVSMAMLAKQDNRYREMIEIMEKIVFGLSRQDELTVDERNLLFFAYKAVFDTLRTAWLKISKIEHKEENRTNKSEIEAEISELCAGILKLLKENLVPSASTDEAKVYYMTMTAEYNRYLAEFKGGQELVKVRADAIDAYEAAQDIALVNLAPSHPARLQLSFSILFAFQEIREHQPSDLEGEALQERLVIRQRLKDLLGSLLFQRRAWLKLEWDRLS